MKNKLRPYLATLTDPINNKGERVGRVFSLVLFVIALVTNLFAFVVAVSIGELGGVVNLAIAVVFIVVIIASFINWRREDSIIRLIDDMPNMIARRIREEREEDPFAYAMMRAMKDGEGFHMQRGEDGLWRDGSTDQVIPIQDEDSGPEKGV